MVKLKQGRIKLVQNWGPNGQIDRLTDKQTHRHIPNVQIDRLTDKQTHT